MENKTETQVEKFDPATLMDGVRNRIKATFVSLIPDAQWEQMCDAEMKKFFEKTYEMDYYNKPQLNKPKPSEFELIVMDLMKQHCVAYLKELLAKPEYSISKVFENSAVANKMMPKVELSEHLDSMIKEKMPDMMQAMFQRVMADSFYDFFINIQSRIQQKQF